MKKLLLGNAAVARGAYEAGVRVVSSYPGTPSTEITEQGIKNANVDKEDGITSKDVAYILQKALDSTFLMPVEQ